MITSFNVTFCWVVTKYTIMIYNFLFYITFEGIDEYKLNSLLMLSKYMKEYKYDG